MADSNAYNIVTGENLPNHSESLKGRGKFIRQSVPEIPTFRTRQAAYRYAAWLIELAGHNLPDDEGCEGQSFEDVHAAVTAQGAK